MGILEVVDTYAQKYERHIPVVVAGGIYDRSDLEHVLALGADGVQMGTRFVTTYECDASEAYKQTYLDCRQEDIRIVDSPVGLPGRAISNPFLSEAKGCGVTGKCYKCLERCNPSKIPYCITRALVNAVKGNTDQGLLFAETMRGGHTGWSM